MILVEILSLVPKHQKIFYYFGNKNSLKWRNSEVGKNETIELDNSFVYSREYFIKNSIYYSYYLYKYEN